MVATQFRAQKYEDFVKRWGIDHISSSPYHSQSNGKAESAVIIAKTMLKKVTQANMNINLAMLAWHNTPTEGSLYSPVQKLQSRRTRMQLPTSSKLLIPEVAKGIVEQIQCRKDRVKQQFDKTAKELPELVIDKLFASSPSNIESHSYEEGWCTFISSENKRGTNIQTQQKTLTPNSRTTIRDCYFSSRGCRR